MQYSVEITVVSAEDLRIGKKPVKKNAFVKMKADSAVECCTTVTSAEERGGNNNLTIWNEKLAVDLRPGDLRSGFITVEVYCKVTSSKNKLVGGVRVPVSDFLGGFLPSNHPQFLSYRLWDSTYERNGVINISVRVKSPEPVGRRCSQGVTVLPKKATVGAPFRGEVMFSGGGVVTGVPAAWLGRHHCKLM
ncbi:hypothetical protein SAY86_027248 [Trapa natans]|uniref:C2 domain-containing protein n=1 Tax=Trapa natans TaxID=22666 RepID=A0AAN7QKD5_TRANT|nr:hypothetical protein SAY86_027248 [Trapa natans]